MSAPVPAASEPSWRAGRRNWPTSDDCSLRTEVDRMSALVRVSFPRMAVAPRAICPFPRALPGAAAIPLSVPALIAAVAGLLLRAAQNPAADTRSGFDSPAPIRDVQAVPELTYVERLVYELLDAHVDT